MESGFIWLTVWTKRKLRILIILEKGRKEDKKFDKTYKVKSNK